uniref:Histone deacetylase 11 n=1 Tax=Lynx canadensis TaxID=61383 RepID=A0A667H851_LYNCA
MGLEKLHPFDAGKWGKVISFLKEEKLLSDGMLVEAREASDEDLLVVHTRRYLNELKWSFAVATITEIPPVIFLPNFLVQRKVLKPLRTQTGGTIMAGKLAMERGWAINVGGGFHHCSSDRGGGFCAYADITLAIKFLFERVEGISRATIVDLDAHQGNGHERDFMGDKRVYIMDVYNRHIYPGDRFAKQAIRRKVELEWGTEDDEYLDKVERNLQKALQEHLPDVVVYNAGTDILEGDRLGGLSISPQVRPCPEGGAGGGVQQGRWAEAAAITAGLPEAAGPRPPARVSLPLPPTGHREAGRTGVSGGPRPPGAHPHGDLGRIPEAHGPHHCRLHP